MSTRLAGTLPRGLQPLPRKPRTVQALPRAGATNDAVGAWMRSIHEEISAFFVRLDGGTPYAESVWERPGGGGGVSRVIEGGALWEKAGFNWSAVHGPLPLEEAVRLGARLGRETEVSFFATGVSVVVHPRSPMVPTLHLNIRFFRLLDPRGRPIDSWFGGGTDLTPYYPFEEDAAHFHRVLRDACTQRAPGQYPRFKRLCDEYFVNRHRGNEARGVGGIFFDNLRPEAGARGAFERLAGLADAVGRILPLAYEPIVERRRDLPCGERERDFQLMRRGRYVEFNLVHDRGTRFGLQTGARIESVLMSMPPTAAWPTPREYEPGSFERRLLDMLPPRDWAAAT